MAQSLYPRQTGAPSTARSPPLSQANKPGAQLSGAPGLNQTWFLKEVQLQSVQLAESVKPLNVLLLAYKHRHCGPAMFKRRHKKRRYIKEVFQFVFTVAIACNERENTRSSWQQKDSLFTVFPQTLKHASWINHSRLQRGETLMYL